MNFFTINSTLTFFQLFQEQVARVIRLAMRLLGIDVPERM